MKAVVWRDAIELEHMPCPKAEKGNILVKVMCAGICGSDITIIAGKHPRARPPLILGHEFMGTLADDLNTGTGFIAKGTRVVVEPLISCKTCRPCREGHEHVCGDLQLLGVETDGGFAEYVAVPVEKVYPLPFSISDEEAALIEPLSVAVHAVSFAPPRENDVIVVLGAGPIGLLTAQVVRARGARWIYLCDINNHRLELAHALGFSVVHCERRNVVEEVLRFTDGHGADITFEAAGVPATAGWMIPLTGIKGKIVMIAIHKKPSEVHFQQLAYREQAIYGVRIYGRGDFNTAIKLASTNKVKLKPLITHRYTLEQCHEAVETARTDQTACKVLMRVV